MVEQGRAFDPLAALVNDRCEGVEAGTMLPAVKSITYLARLGERYCFKNANTSEGFTSDGSLAMTEKKTFRSKATANQLLGRARAPTNVRY